MQLYLSLLTIPVARGALWWHDLWKRTASPHKVLFFSGSLLRQVVCLAKCTKNGPVLCQSKQQVERKTIINFNNILNR